MKLSRKKLFALGAVVETYFTTKELSEYLKIPEQSIRRWVLNNEIPFNRIHNVIRYRLSEIEIWIGNNKDKINTVDDSVKEGDLFNENDDCEAVSDEQANSISVNGSEHD